MIDLVEAHAMIGLGPGNSPTPIPNLTYVVSDEGSIRRSATEPPRPIRQSKAWFGGEEDERVLANIRQLGIQVDVVKLGLALSSMSQKTQGPQHHIVLIWFIFLDLSPFTLCTRWHLIPVVRFYAWWWLRITWALLWWRFGWRVYCWQWVVLESMSPRGCLFLVRIINCCFIFW